MALNIKQAKQSLSMLSNFSGLQMDWFSLEKIKATYTLDEEI